MKELGQLRTREIQQRSRTRNLIIGAGIGSAVGVAAGILFAPQSGRETRHIIANRAGETVKHLKENVAASKVKILASAAEKKKKSSE
ncbi:MAG: YtxH domain-containing protein [Desulfamplus sp.]|nr:YtxH domain-containing protein [Desulfamplus sp.]